MTEDAVDLLATQNENVRDRIATDSDAANEFHPGQPVRPTCG